MTIITAGSAYSDIDVLACSLAYRDLLRLQIKLRRTHHKGYRLLLAVQRSVQELPAKLDKELASGIIGLHRTAGLDRAICRALRRAVSGAGVGAM